MGIEQYISDADLLNRFEFYNYNHALEILTQAFPEEWDDIQQCLKNLRITVQDIQDAGGNETRIPKKFDASLYPCGWKEIRIAADLHVKLYSRRDGRRSGFATQPEKEHDILGFIDGHNIDFVKNRIAFDLEWNSKDQTFDRDLLAMRTYYECDVISAGIIVTRSRELNDVFRTVLDEQQRPILRKYGASTTWMGKLLPRLDARRNGGCPILAVGIRKACIVDWKEGFPDGSDTRNDR